MSDTPDFDDLRAVLRTEADLHEKFYPSDTLHAIVPEVAATFIAAYLEAVPNG